MVGPGGMGVEHLTPAAHTPRAVVWEASKKEERLLIIIVTMIIAIIVKKQMRCYEEEKLNWVPTAF